MCVRQYAHLCVVYLCGNYILHEGSHIVPFLFPVALQIVTCPAPLGKGSQGVWQFFMGSPLWGESWRAAPERGYSPYFADQRPVTYVSPETMAPLRVQPCCFCQKRRISTSSAQCAHWAPSPPGEGLRKRSPSSLYGSLTD